jgi:hypothetical protein
MAKKIEKSAKASTDLVNALASDTEVPEVEETPTDEAAESPAKQAEEEEMGTEMHGEEEAEEGSVKVPEAFQREVEGLIASATKEQLAYLRNCIMEKEDALRKTTAKPEFSVEGMPD